MEKVTKLNKGLGIPIKEFVREYKFSAGYAKKYTPKVKFNIFYDVVFFRKFKKIFCKF